MTASTPGRNDRTPAPADRDPLATFPTVKPENPSIDTAMDQDDGIGASGMDLYEAHEGGLATDRSLGAEQEPSTDEAGGDGLVDESVNPDTSFRAGYSLEDDEDQPADTPVFDVGEELPGLNVLYDETIVDEDGEEEPEPTRPSREA